LTHPDRFAYRLREWPKLENGEQSVHLLRAFSRMSLGPVTFDWFCRNARLQPHFAQELLQRLEQAGAMEAIDLSGLIEARAHGTALSTLSARLSCRAFIVRASVMTGVVALVLLST
jgi:hypothetical protein